MSRRLIMLPILCGWLFLSFAIHAQAPRSAADTKHPTLEAIMAQQAQIRADLQAGAKQYRHVDPLRRRQIYAAQKIVFRLLEGHQQLDELGTDDQLEVFNALNHVQSHLVKQDVDDRMVCERVAVVGTRRYEMACMTEAERRQRADSAREALMHRPACTTEECGGG